MQFVPLDDIDFLPLPGREVHPLGKGVMETPEAGGQKALQHL